jgi:membrane fusion protein, heavy metal efflux system
MKTENLEQQSPAKRRWWARVALLTALAGLVIAACCLTPIGRLATDAYCAIVQPRAETQAHNHATEVAGGEHNEDGHAHEGEAPSAAATESEHDHEAEAAAGHQHEETGTITLSRQAQGNIGLKLATVELRPFERTMNVPGIVVERPGWSVLEVNAPMTGVVTRIYPIQGEAVEPGQKLFEVRLTHEDLLQAQTEYLRTIEELEVIGREVTRLEKVSADGVIPGKALLERQYEQQKQQAALRAQSQALLLHGITRAQLDKIASTRTLLESLTIYAPETQEPGSSVPPRHLQIQQLKAAQGKHVNAGDMLCTLVDHHELYIEGRAFEQDASALDKLINNDWRLTAVISADGQSRQTVPDLQLLYVASQIEPESRAFLFYVQLPNKLVRSAQASEGHRFLAWQFKPGQRVELLVPVEKWPDCIVLPVGAVVQDAAESYVFEEESGHFDRRSVRVEYRDQYSAVVANDGTLTLGKQVIVSGAYQLHLAMKNKAGGAPDPHAGHNH